MAQQATKKSNTEKRVPKSTPKLSIDLSEEQKKVAELFYQYDVLFVHGDFASGKTMSAVHTALTWFNKRQCNSIWITRPMLKGNLAALPGSLAEKMEPYVFPIKQNLNLCQGKEKTEAMLKNGDIQIMPIEVAKGCSFHSSVVIVDEYEDMDYEDFRTILTRLSKGSKMIFCGSKKQVDKRVGKNSCMEQTIKLKESGIVGYVTLKSNHRNPILTDIINYLEGDERNRD